MNSTHPILSLTIEIEQVHPEEWLIKVASCEDDGRFFQMRQHVEMRFLSYLAYFIFSTIRQYWPEAYYSIHTCTVKDHVDDGYLQRQLNTHFTHYTDLHTMPHVSSIESIEYMGEESRWSDDSDLNE
jgi:hypothetical protein